MNEVIKHIKIDLYNPKVYEVIKAEQGDDNSRCVEFELYNQGNPYEITNDTIANVEGLRADGSGYIKSCEINNNIITFVLDDNLLYYDGVAKLKLVLYSDNKKVLSSIPFKVSIERNPMFNIKFKKDEYSLINDVLNMVGEMDSKVSNVDNSITEHIEPLKATVNNNTNAISEINDNLSSEISRAKEADEILKSRVDVITSLPEGSTTGDAELQDIRVKADGTTATSAGNAVREQISELKSDLDNQNAKHQTITTKNVNETSEYCWYQDGVKQPDREFLSSIKYDVEEVSKVIIKYLNPSLYYDVYDFIDVNGDVINHKYCISSEEIINKIIVVPSNAKYFIINGESNTLNTKKIEFITEITNVIFHENYIKEDSIPKYLVRCWYNNNEIQETPDYLSGTEIVCENFDKVYISGTVDAWYNKYTFLDKNRNVILSSKNNTGTSITLDDFELSVPYDAYYLHVSSGSVNFKGFLPISTKNKRMFDLNKKLNNNFNGVKMYWLGTSIPAGGLDGLTSYYSYPKLVGRRLNASVTNLAVGSSPVHCRRQSLVSTNNPYGFIDSFESVSRCLTNTLEMCEWIISHYTMFSDAPSEMSESLKTFIRSCSYENRIIPYLTEPSIWVFDHGFNDGMEDESLYSESDKFSTFTFRGACNFIFNLILSNQPKSIIYFVGVTTYENRVAQAENQMIVANDWKFPFIKLWDELGWSEKTISTKSGWINGIWTENVHTTPVTMSMRDVALPDGIHPHTDLTFGALNQIAMILSKWIDSNGYYQSINRDDYNYFWVQNNLW